ncbi:MAG: hypothetical protein IJD33_03285, partial [Clostridia bacterium]|nr:hypothetical protein [Clostridia bacterium]
PTRKKPLYRHSCFYNFFFFHTRYRLILYTTIASNNIISLSMLVSQAFLLALMVKYKKGENI